MTEKPLKILLLGDEKVGKTSLYNKYVNGTFSSEYIPSKGPLNKKMSLNVNGESINLHFWDLPGNEKKHKVYMSIYLNTNCIILLFDITNKTSFDNIFIKWIPDFYKFFQSKQIEIPNFPIVVLGNFSDLSDKRAITKEEIQTKLKDINKYSNFYIYQEISTKNENSLENLIKKIIIFVNSRSQIFGDSTTQPPTSAAQPPKQGANEA